MCDCSSDILQAVVPQMCSNDEVIRKHCCHAVAQVVAGDAEGKMVLEVPVASVLLSQIRFCGLFEAQCVSV